MNEYNKHYNEENAAALRKKELQKAISDAKESQNEKFGKKQRFKKQNSEISIGLNKKLKN